MGPPVTTPSPRPAPIAVVETSGRGHHPWYLRLILEELRRSRPGSRIVVISTAQAVGSEAWRLHLSEIDVETVLVDGQGNVPAEAVAVAQRLGAELVIPDGEPFLRIARTLPPDLRGALLLLRSHPQPGPRALGRFLTKCLLIRTLRRRVPGMQVLSLESTAGTQQNLMRRLGVTVALDPVSYAPAASVGLDWLEANGVRTDRPVALVIGDLSERKRVPQILQAWERSARRTSLVLVGRPSPATQAVLDRIANTDGLYVRTGVVSDGEFDAWIGSVDVVFAVHSNPGPSGVLLKAWAAGVSAVVNDGPLVARVCQELGIDAVPSSGSPAELKEILDGLIRQEMRSSGPRLERVGKDVPLALTAGLLS